MGHALSWETRSRIVALWLMGLQFTQIASQVQCAYNTVKNIVNEFTTTRRLAPRAQTGAWSRPPKMRVRELLYPKVRANSTRTARVNVEKKLQLTRCLSPLLRSSWSKRGRTSRVLR